MLKIGGQSARLCGEEDILSPEAAVAISTAQLEIFTHTLWGLPLLPLPLSKSVMRVQRLIKAS